ncbi:formate dehydrogenase [Breoghania corrubedonensis]|uniref:formate dehydrogenase n=1 Tax=Breoghania corrubedonensis TaxID=665038 RepID=UPI000D3A6B6E|nr:formate dehydrogenase [Breoghania corrubedonensis]
MADQQRRESVDRRSFLKFATLGGGAAAVAFVADSGAAAAEADAATPAGGYSESAHIRAYYDSARM